MSKLINIFLKGVCTTFLPMFILIIAGSSQLFANDDSLNQTIEELKATVEELQEWNDELEERLGKVEKHKALDRINFSGEMRIIHHGMDYLEEKTDLAPEIKENAYVNQLKVKLNMRSEVINNFRFTGRIIIFKNWGENVIHDLDDFQEGGFPDNADLHLERAYIDYFINSRISLSFGRLPTTDGPPYELLNNTTRKSTYPGALYDLESDGLALSVNLPQWSVFSPTFRYIHAQMNFNPSEMIYRESTYNTLLANVYQFESELSLGSTSGFIIYDHIFLDDVNYQLSTYEEIDEALRSNGLDPYETNEIDTFGQFVGNMLHIQLMNIQDTGLDGYVTYNALEIKSNGKRLKYNSQVPVPMGDTVQYMDMPVYCLGFLQSDNCQEKAEKKSEQGYSVNFGVRYKLPWENLNYPKIGIDSHQASKKYFGLGQRTEYGDLNIEFNNIRGNALHLYWIQPLERYLFLRIGMKDLKPDYEGGANMLPFERKRSLRDVYALINAKF